MRARLKVLKDNTIVYETINKMVYLPDEVDVEAPHNLDEELEMYPYRITVKYENQNCKQPRSKKRTK